MNKDSYIVLKDAYDEVHDSFNVSKQIPNDKAPVVLEVISMIEFKKLEEKLTETVKNRDIFRDNQLKAEKVAEERLMKLAESEKWLSESRATNIKNQNDAQEFKYKLSEALEVIKTAADFLGQDNVTEKMAHECHYVLMNFLAKHEIKGSENEKRN